MTVPEKRHRVPAPARVIGTVAAAVAASMIVVPGAHATTALSSAQAPTSVVSSEAPATVETVVSVQDAEMVFGTTGQLQATVETVDGDPVTSGEVTFLLNGRTQSAEVTDGTASVAVTTEDFGSVHGYPLNHGGYWFRATYTGAGHTDAEDSAKLQVVKADPALEATITPEAVPGEPVIIEGRITAVAGNEGQPQGSLQLVVDGEPVGEPVHVADDGAFSTQFTAPESWEPGEHTVELTLGRHGNFTAATFTLTTTVAPVATETVVSVQDAEIVYGTTGQLEAAVETVDGDPVTSGEVTFLLNGRTQSADVVDGSASVPVTTEDFGSVHGYPLNHGGYWFRATYTGAGHTDAEASAKLQVVKAPVQLDASLDQDEIEAGDTVALEGRVTALEGNEGQPLGDLQVIVDGEPTGEAVQVSEDGSFRTELTLPEDATPGARTIALVYGESANFTEGTLEIDLTVVAPDDGPGSVWDAVERLLRELLDWLGSLFGGR